MDSFTNRLSRALDGQQRNTVMIIVSDEVSSPLSHLTVRSSQFRNGTAKNFKMHLALESPILIKSARPFTKNTTRYTLLLSDQMNSMTRTNHLSKIHFAEIQIIITRIEFKYLCICPSNLVSQVVTVHFNDRLMTVEPTNLDHVSIVEFDKRSTLKTSTLVWIKPVIEFWDRSDTRNEDLSSKMSHYFDS